MLHCISGSLRVGPGWEPLVGLRLLVAYFTDGGSLWADGRLLVGLFLLGCLQAVLYLRTGSLWAGSGFHAGLYFFSKVMKKVYRPDAFPSLAGGRRGVRGLGRARLGTARRAAGAGGTGTQEVVAHGPQGVTGHGTTVASPAAVPG